MSVSPGQSHPSEATDLSWDQAKTYWTSADAAELRKMLAEEDTRPVPLLDTGTFPIPPAAVMKDAAAVVGAEQTYIGRHRRT